MRMKSYLITDPALYPSAPPLFQNYLREIFHLHHPHCACLRDSKESRRELLAPLFVRVCQECGVIPLLNSDIKMALAHGFEGVHLKGNQLGEIPKLQAYGLKSFYSAHSLQDLQRASKAGVGVATISPIFATPNKGEPLGIEFLEILEEYAFACEIFALGGIVSQKEIDLLKGFSSINGFASIRFFLPLPPN